jgi:acetyltransferase-like isoleucine patch superfamily enzyme
MRKITGLQITCFTAILSGTLGLAIATGWVLLGQAPTGRFNGVVLTAGSALFFYIFAFVAYRLFLYALPLRPGQLQPSSRAEFSAQVYLLFQLVIFNSLIRTHFVPIPVMRLIYIALGAKLGRDTYSAGALLDPPLTSLGDECIVGHDAVIFAHVIEGSRFELATVRIGHRVTIGAHAVVMPDVVIGDDAIVSVGAVVTKGTRIGPGELWGGVPARCITRRNLLEERA